MTSELKSLEFDLGITMDANKRVEEGKNGSRPSLGLVGWWKTETGIGDEATAGWRASFAAADSTTTVKLQHNAARQLFKNCLRCFTSFMRRWVLPGQ